MAMDVSGSAAPKPSSRGVNVESGGATRVAVGRRVMRHAIAGKALHSLSRPVSEHCPLPLRLTIHLGGEEGCQPPCGARCRQVPHAQRM